MKKIVFVSICLVATLFLMSSAKAQKYVTFESKAFSVLLKCSPDYAKVLEVSFSEKGAWVPYKLLKTLPLENANEVGNRYIVEDAQKVNYTIEYVKGKNVLFVTNQKSKTKVSLKKK